MRQILSDAYHTLRLSAFGATAALPLLGAAVADRTLDGRRAAGLLGVAAAFHTFAYVHNDLCDLELDRTQPLRAAYPLVRGALAPRAALALALASLPAAFALDALASAPGRTGARRARLATALALLAAYNHWGKRCSLPPLTDLIQALGWAALLAYGAAASGQADPPLLRLLVVYELALIMQVNGIHGALRDLANDHARGARTTAIWLGARPGPTGDLQITRALAAYALALQATLLALPLAGAAAKQPAHQSAARSAAILGVTATTGLTIATFAAAARGGARPVDVGMLQLILILSAPVALIAPGMAPAPRALLLLAHSLPLLSNSMTYDALRWALKQMQPTTCSGQEPSSAS
jgi:4-hydroxybenzoate polyprenyltransferase